MHRLPSRPLLRAPRHARLLASVLLLLVATVVAGSLPSAARTVDSRPVDSQPVDSRPVDADRPERAAGVWPLTPRPQVAEGFDPPAARWAPGHRGVDLVGGPLSSVRAALAGRVAFAGRIAGRGVVVIDHGSTRTTYEPVSATVDVGDLVATGSVIGRLQLFGSHCFPRWCLHWGLIRGREYLDPLTLVGAVPVRLLPLAGRPHDRGLLTVPAPDPWSGRAPPPAAWSRGLRLVDAPGGTPAGAGRW